jgi:hypothetical protein
MLLHIFDATINIIIVIVTIDWISDREVLER